MSGIVANWQDMLKNRKPSFWLTARRLWPILRPFTRRMLIVVLCGVLAAVADLLSIGLLFPLLQTIVGRQTFSFVPGIEGFWLVEWLSTLSIEARIRWLLAGMLVIQAVREATVYMNAVIVTRTHANLANTLRLEVYDRIITMPLDTLQSVPIAHYYTILNSFSQQAADATMVVLRMVVPVLGIAVAAAVLAYLSPVLTLVALGSVVAVAFAISNIVSRQQKIFARLGDDGAALNHRTFELFSAIRTVRLFNREELMRTKQIEVADRYWKTYRRSQYLAQVISPVTQLLTIASAVAIFMLGTALFVDRGGAWVETILLYLYVMMRLTAPASQLNTLRSELAARAPGADLIAEFVADTPKPVRVEAMPDPRLNGSVIFQGVSFRYAQDAPDVLRSVDFTIVARKVTAIVGPSGAGKSTLVDLLLGLRRPTVGRILIGDVDIAGIDGATLRRHVALVSQDTYLFADTIRENIRFGRPDATDAEIADAVRRANLDTVIASLPDGLNTWVGERGVRLSGGQAQRVAIARAVLADPAVLVLDEATSAQDAESERAIQDAVHRLSRDRTVLLIAHRLATVREADEIVVLERGAVVERGTHANLIAEGGLYSRFVNLQDLRP